MRKLLLLITILSMLNMSLIAQKEYSISNKTPYGWAPLSQGEVNIHSSLTNNATNPNDTSFQIVYLSSNMPTGWALGVCTDLQCFSVGTSGLNEPFYTLKNKTADLKCTFSYGSPGLAGPAFAKFLVYRAGMSNNGDTITFSTVAPSTGINNANKAVNVSISPNPVKNDLIISLTDNNISSLSIINLVGKEVMTLDYKTGKTFDVSALPNGIYFLHITKGEATFNKKFIISK